MIVLLILFHVFVLPGLLLDTCVEQSRLDTPGQSVYLESTW